MIKITCHASDCDKEFVPKMPHTKYCSDKCRSREYKRGVYAQRAIEGLCPQCGGEMEPAEPLKDKTTSYCKECQEYFQNRYESKKG